MELGERSPCEIVGWVKDHYHLKERIGQLKGADGRCLNTDNNKLQRLVTDLFDEEGAEAAAELDCLMGYMAEVEVVIAWFRKAMVRMKNNSTIGPDRFGYRLLKAVKKMKM